MHGTYDMEIEMIPILPMLPIRSATVWDHAGTLLQLCSLVKIVDRKNHRFLGQQ